MTPMERLQFNKILVEHSTKKCLENRLDLSLSYNKTPSSCL